MRVLLLCGSPRLHQYTHSGLIAIEQRLLGLGVKTTLWHQALRPLPVMDTELRRLGAAHPDENVRWLMAQAESAAGFVWGSPLYHNSYSGVLKNALDTLRTSHFEGKPVALHSHGGQRAAVRAADHLRIVARGVYALAVTAQVSTVSSDFEEVQAEDKPHRLANPGIGDRMDELATELVDWMKRFRVGDGPSET